VICFLKFLTPSALGACNFLNYILFLTIFTVPDAPIGGGSSFVWTQQTMEPSIRNPKLRVLGPSFAETRDEMKSG